MTPKEKAEELVDKFIMNVLDYEGTSINCHKAKQSALVAVDEIIRLNIFDCNDEWSDEDGDTREYWQEVKMEIEKL